MAFVVSLCTDHRILNIKFRCKMDQDKSVFRSFEKAFRQPLTVGRPVH